MFGWGHSLPYSCNEIVNGIFVFNVYIHTDLDVHPEEANIDTILLLEGKHGSGSVGEVIHHFTSVNISAQWFLSKNCFKNKVLYFSPLFHPRLDLDLLVPGEHDPNVDISGVGLLLPQEIVDPGLDVRAEASDLELLRRELVIFPRCTRCFVTSITFKSSDINVNRSF